MKTFVGVWLAVLLHTVSTSGPSEHHTMQSFSTKDTLTIIVDVDNTLYCEQQVKRLGRVGIEEQIVHNTHCFCQTHLNLTPEEADDLYRRYGSTIEGIRQTYPSSTHLLERFYREVYDTIDVRPLIQGRRSHMDDTGYSHAGDSLVSLQRYLEHIPHPIYVASNSPSWHVAKVLAALGLSNVPWEGMLTPDLITHDEHLPFPTKAHPETFYSSLRNHPCVVLIDDSQYNVKKAEDMGFRAIRVDHVNCTLEQALNQAVGHVDANYEMKDLEYLKSKNICDAQSIHAPTYHAIAQHLYMPQDGILRVADVGAGLLSMLELLLEGRHDKQPLLNMLNKKVKGIEYVAYEPNMGLLDGCRETLSRLGFEFVRKEQESTYVFHRDHQNVTVHLKMMDFTKEDCKMELQLVVGCCFADLMDPHALVESLLRFTGSGDTVLVYFPITFARITQFLPPQPFGSEKMPRRIPSDTAAFGMYSDALMNQHGHNLEPTKLVDAMKEYGGILLRRGPSNWKIDPTENEYLWKTMLYFFGTVGAPEMMKRGWDSVGWMARAKQGRPKIDVANIDLLFRLPREASGGLLDSSLTGNEDKDELLIEEIQFTAPYEVGTVSKTVDTTDGAHLGPNQVEGMKASFS